HERLELVLALDDQPERNRLNAAGRDTTTNFVPEQRTDLITNEPVENASRLLRVNDVLIDAAGMFDSRADRFRRNLIEENPKDFSIFVAVEDLFQMLANGFSLTVRF